MARSPPARASSRPCSAADRAVLASPSSRRTLARPIKHRALPALLPSTWLSARLSFSSLIASPYSACSEARKPAAKSALARTGKLWLRVPPHPAMVVTSHGLRSGAHERTRRPTGIRPDVALAPRHWARTRSRRALPGCCPSLARGGQATAAAQVREFGLRRVRSARPGRARGGARVAAARPPLPDDRRHIPGSSPASRSGLRPQRVRPCARGFCLPGSRPRPTGICSASPSLSEAPGGSTTAWLPPATTFRRKSELPKERSLFRSEQVVAPFDSCSQRPMASRLIPCTAGQKNRAGC